MSRVRELRRRYEMALREQVAQTESMVAIDAALTQHMTRLAAEMEARANERDEDRFAATGLWRGARDLATSGRWQPPSAGADEEMAHDLIKLRKRSADLVKNNAWAATLVGSLVDQVVGAGFELQSTTRAETVGADEDFVDGWRQACEDVWAAYVDQSDVCEQCNVHEQVRLLYLGSKVRGDAFLVRRSASRNAPERDFVTRWQLVEAEQIRTPVDELDTYDLRFGVKLGKFGRPIGYFLHDYHEFDAIYAPSDSRQAYRFLRKIEPSTGQTNVIHMMRAQRPGQTRGLPWLSPVIPWLDDLGQYEDAVIIREKLAASISMFLKRNRSAPQSLRDAAASADKGNTPLDRVKWRPGGVAVIDSGTEVQIPELKVPTTAYGEFIRVRMQAICAALGFPSIWAMKDYERANYSNLRGAAMDAKVLVDTEQTMVGAVGYRPLYQSAIEEAWSDGRMGRYSREVQLWDARGNRTPLWGEWLRVRTQGPVRGVIDLDKEIQAYALAVEKGFLTHADVNQMLTGRDYRDQFAQRARERDEAARLKLNSTDARVDMDAYGVGVRAGVITPQIEDEEAARDRLGLPEPSEATRAAWSQPRRPVTLAAPEQPADPAADPAAIEEQPAP